MHRAFRELGCRRLGLITAVLLLPLSVDAQVSYPRAPVASRGQALYQSNCATCHGHNGRGSKPDDTGLEIPLPDFTDCAFSSREAERDWAGIVHQGGPVRAFDERMPAFGGVLSESDIERVVRYVKQFCSDDSWPQGDLNFPRAILTEKAFPENELLLISGVTLEGQAEVSGKLIYEQRIGARTQFEVVAPFGVFRRSDAERRATGLARLGAGPRRRGLWHQTRRFSPTLLWHNREPRRRVGDPHRQPRRRYGQGYLPI